MSEPRQATGRRIGGAPAPSPQPAVTPLPREVQLNVKIPHALRDRALNAFYATRVAGVWKNFVQQALEQFVTQLEDQHNGGQPFPPRPPDMDKLPPGRPPK